MARWPNRQKILYSAVGFLLYLGAALSLLRTVSPNMRVSAQTLPDSSDTVYLPLVSHELPPTPTPTPTLAPTPTLTPTPAVYTGEWKGTTSFDFPVSFVVSGDSLSVENFRLDHRRQVFACTATASPTAKGPLAIADMQFKGNAQGDAFKFTGRFTSPTRASGTFIFTRYTTDCGWLTKEGTWTASR